MEINWVVVGWIIDMILNGVVWLVIAVLALLLIDITDKWTRKALKFMGRLMTGLENSSKTHLNGF